ncbi:MAG TPA: alpha/beta hydrolase [Acidimicrobiales bacterium]|jgi:acetyl esterase/lipase|nr:alpha/beta hydrolase [Acidimicrobiales bacterium]
MTHPGVEIVTAFLAEAGLLSGPIEDQRAAMDAASLGAPPPEGISVETAELGGRPAEWLVPDGVERDTAVLYLHGGGYCSGSLNSHRDLAARIGIASGSAVATLDYRLAPENPFPAAVTDAVAAYRQLMADGIGPDHLAVAGDSAGGGLVVALLLALRSEGIPLPAAAVCLSPWVDLTQSGTSYEELVDRDPMLSQEDLDVLATAYLAGADPRTELASPLLAEDLSGLPPLLIEVGAHEVLLDDATRLAERVTAAGGEATLTVWPEMIHVFQAFPGAILPETDLSVAAIGNFVSGHLAG